MSAMASLTAPKLLVNSLLDSYRDVVGYEKCRLSSSQSNTVRYPVMADLRISCQAGAAVSSRDCVGLTSISLAPLRGASRSSSKSLGSSTFKFSKSYVPARSSRKGGARCLAMEATEEAVAPFDRGSSWSSNRVSGFQDGLKDAVRLPRNRADDASVMNPLERLHRMGCGWFAVVVEWDGVMVEDDAALEAKAWAALAEEEGRPQPPAFMLRRAEGMKNEQVISEVICWTRDFLKMKRLAMRKEEIYQEMQGGCYRVRPGAREFIETLRRHSIPMAVVSSRPRRYLERAIEAVGMEGFFNVVIAAEDVYRGKPDPEMYQYAAEKLQVMPERCVVVGCSNSSIEAAHDTLMKCIAVAGKHPAYELGAAELVVRRLDELSIVDFKNLADLDSPEFLPPEPVVEEEPEEEEPLPKVAVAEKWDW
eukprot:TRINITY_DN4529_c0_g2_i1.p1 TRINITY_DN4529_c0_g2~~TRINITY_DN4529_c0_g2_i1.p1  ORF type:complete len:421 (-),score=69.67 TRINITY_DN4529_c0_g2_i1:338-1600(-)